MPFLLSLSSSYPAATAAATTTTTTPSSFSSSSPAHGERSQRTLGPCADAMGINTAVAFWLGVAQLPLMIILALHFPMVRIDLFDTSIRLAYDSRSNQTAIAAANASAVHISTYEHNVSITGLFLINAASYTFFVVLTMNLLDRGIVATTESASSASSSSVSHNEEFVAHNIRLVTDPTFRMWNQVSMIRKT
jgi:hypothetical protein